MTEAVILALIGIITTAGGFVGRWIFKRLDELQAEIRALQTERVSMITLRAQLEAEIAGLRAQLATLEDARKERDHMRRTIAELTEERDELRAQLARYTGHKTTKLHTAY